MPFLRNSDDGQPAPRPYERPENDLDREANATSDQPEGYDEKTGDRIKYATLAPHLVCWRKGRNEPPVINILKQSVRLETDAVNQSKVQDKAMQRIFVAKYGVFQFLHLCLARNPQRLKECL